MSVKETVGLPQILVSAYYQGIFTENLENFAL